MRPNSIRKHRPELLTGSLRKTMFLLALPILFEQFLNFLVGFYDTYLSGRISADATTAIGLAAYVGWLASMMFGLVGTGTTALVSRSWGAGDHDAANRITNRSIALAAWMGLLVYGLIYWTAPTIAHLLDMTGESRRIVVRYLRIDGLGYLFTSISMVGAAALRGVGDMRSPMKILGLVSILNVIISTALVYGVGPYPTVGLNWAVVPQMGIDGIVLGTVTARLMGGLLMLTALARGLSGLQLSRRELTIRGETVRRILRIGVPAAADGAVMWFGQFLFLMVIARLDSGGRESAVFAAHMIGIRVEAITYLPAVAWGAAAATMVGQSLGAGDKRRAIQSGHEAVIQCTLLAILLSVAFFFGADSIYSLMHRETLVHEIGVPAFQMMAFFQVPLVVAIIYVSALRGAGDTRYPLLITTFTVLFIRVPGAYYFGIVLEGGLFGAWIGMCADMAVRALLIAFRYVHGRWVETEV